MWRDHYSDIFNAVNQTIDVVYNVDESTDFGDVVVPSEEVERAVRELVVNKSCGIDGIYAEHYVIFFSCFVSFARTLVGPTALQAFYVKNRPFTEQIATEAFSAGFGLVRYPL